MSSFTNRFKQFTMTNQLLEHDLNLVEQKYGIDLERGLRGMVQADEAYYPQIEQDIRAEAAAMAPHYEVFYSLEKTIRRLICDTLVSVDGDTWWSGKRVGAALRKTVSDRRTKELDSGVTPRSTEDIDFCTFGELGELIKTNWDVFGSIFSSIKAVERVMASLNTLRGPIAHCSPLADDEIVRLQLAVRDWFRLME